MEEQLEKELKEIGVLYIERDRIAGNLEAVNKDLLRRKAIILQLREDIAKEKENGTVADEI